MEMRDKGESFEAALEDAQKRGYAEADPTFDIEGIDAAHKLTIMSAIAFGVPMQFEKVYTEWALPAELYVESSKTVKFGPHIGALLWLANEMTTS